MADNKASASSFRDPSGFVFALDGVVFRQVNQSFKPHLDLLIDSGLYRNLTDSKLLVSHEELTGSERESVRTKLAEKFSGKERYHPCVETSTNGSTCYKVLKPRQIPFISYPYEWSFSQLKDAALLTIGIQKIAMEHGMVLKDASAYNVQFLEGAPVLIDTLSFEKYIEGQPWIAYRQFCQHFLAPLALMSVVDMRLSQLSLVNIDGIPLDLAATLLPKSTLLNVGLLTHLHMHSKAQQKYSKNAAQAESQSKQQLSKSGLFAIVDNLESCIKGLKTKEHDTFWKNYYDEHNYSNEAFENKKKAVSDFLDDCAPSVVWDLGANTGVFSRIAAAKGALTISADLDHMAVEANYLKAKSDGDKNIHPLLVNLTAPPPAIGWANEERMTLADRGPADAILALALVHHLAIGNNVPLPQIAQYFSTLAHHVIIEFVPKSDSQVRELLANREDIFAGYNQQDFEKAFESFFELVNKRLIAGSERTLYLFKTTNRSTE